ncbi:MAG: DUF4175 family protein [Planctomycetota bacterium]|jgi:hypothetical protein
MGVEQLLGRIDRVRGRERVVLVTGGALKTLLALLALVAGFFILDWFIVRPVVESPGADRLTRAVLALAMSGTLVYVFWQTVLREIRRALDDDEIALRVEKRNPDLRGRLISTIQLTREVDSDPYIGSAELIRALEEDTVSFASSLDFFEIINLKTLKKVAIAAASFTALAVLVATLTGVFAPGYSRAFWSRLFVTGEKYPTRTRIVSITSGGRVPRGEPHPIEVVLDPEKHLPEEVTLVVVPERGGTVSKYLLKEAEKGGGIFRGVEGEAPLERVLEDLRYRAVAYDARSGWQNLRVQRRPAIKELELTYSYPAYAGLPAHTSNVGDIRALVGTTVDITATLSKSVVGAGLRRRVGTQARKPEDMALSDGAKRATARITVTEDGYYRIALQDDEDLANVDPTEYLIDAVDDRAPAIRISFPARNRAATPFARWPIRFEARDDFGIAKGRLKYTVISPPLAGTGGESSEGELPAAKARQGSFLLDGLVPKPSTAAPGAAAGQAVKEIKSEVHFDLREIKPRVDERVVYWIEIEDNKTPQANVGRSKQYEFSIVDAREMIDMMDSVRQDTLGRIEAILRREIKSKDGVDEVRRKVRRLQGETAP